MANRHEEERSLSNFSKYFFVCKQLSKDDVAVARGIVFQEVRPGAGFKAGDFVEEKLEACCKTNPNHVCIEFLFGKRVTVIKARVSIHRIRAR